MLPNIRDDAISALLGLTQSSLSCASYTHLINDFLRQPLTADFHCVRFINGQANFRLQTHAKSHRSQQKGYNLALVEL
jgi:hypothetical protein